jgi:polysaccharide deacetylase family protein (PEP-CTERM system associated)
MQDSIGDRVVLTIDMEDWFHAIDSFTGNWIICERRIEYGTNKILDFLSEKKSTATFFILGDVAQNHPQLVKRIYSEGHEIGSHGSEHKLIYRQTPVEFHEDLKRSIGCLTDLIGEKIISYRAPNFSITKKSLWALDILIEEGIQYDSSIFPIINHRYGIPDNKIFPYRLDNGLWEWPITIYRTFLGNIPFSGGAYFRLFPSIISAFLISSLLKNQGPVLLYFHPWEFDPHQPKLYFISPFLGLRHYYGLHNNFNKFSSLLQNLSVISLREGIEGLGKK